MGDKDLENMRDPEQKTMLRFQPKTKIRIRSEKNRILKIRIRKTRIRKTRIRKTRIRKTRIRKMRIRKRRNWKTRIRNPKAAKPLVAHNKFYTSTFFAVFFVFWFVCTHAMQWAAVTTQLAAIKVAPHAWEWSSPPQLGPSFKVTIQGYLPLLKMEDQFLSLKQKQMKITVESWPPTILRSPSNPHLQLEPGRKLKSSSLFLLQSWNRCFSNPSQTTLWCFCLFQEERSPQRPFLY